jgi:hypothetical protein
MDSDTGGIRSTCVQNVSTVHGSPRSPWYGSGNLSGVIAFRLPLPEY